MHAKLGDGDNGNAVADAPEPCLHKKLWPRIDDCPWLQRAMMATQHTLYNETLPECEVHGKWHSLNLHCKADTPDWFGPDSPDASGCNDTAAMLDST